MTTPRRLRPRRPASARNTELRLALATAGSIQSVIRLGDAKVVSLATITSGAVALAADNAGRGGLPAGVAFLAVIASAAGAAWHLLTAISPRFAAPSGPARGTHVVVTDAKSAWEQAAVLQAIAARKHAAIRRSLPWITAVLVAATTVLILAQLAVHSFG